MRRHEYSMLEDTFSGRWTGWSKPGFNRKGWWKFTPAIQAMFDIGSFPVSDGGRISRRALLRAGFGLPLVSGFCANQTVLAEDAAPAKYVILLWMWGGPSHLDTFDPKPNAPQDIRGPFADIATKTSGLRFSELFPQLAARSGRFSVVRSNVNLDTAHHIAGSIALTGGRGRNGDSDYEPNFGSIAQRSLSTDRALPPFVAIGSGPLNTAIKPVLGFGGGVWGPAFDPFPVRCTELDGVELPTLKLLDGLGRTRLADRERLLQAIEKLKRVKDQSSPENWDENFARGYKLLTSEQGRRAFNLELESQQTRGRFGNTQFGQSCLLARRLVEAGVPYVQVNWSEWVENIYDARTDFGWDTHWLNFEHMTDRHGPIFDRAASALLDDLDERGLLDSTLVLALGEFGRTPRISKNGGRDHWARCYSSLWAGGGIQPGRVIGTSDDRAYDPISDPVTPDMVGATILEQLGIRTEQRAELRVLPTGQVIDALL